MPYLNNTMEQMTNLFDKAFKFPSFPSQTKTDKQVVIPEDLLKQFTQMQKAQ
jgi:hypothetical protein